MYERRDKLVIRKHHAITTEVQLKPETYNEWSVALFLPSISVILSDLALPYVEWSQTTSKKTLELTFTARGSTLVVRIWRLLQTSDSDVYSRSPHCKNKNMCTGRRPIT